MVEAKVECKGRQIDPSWDRVRVFDHAVGAMFLRSIQQLGTATVTDVTQKEKTRSRPCALNTVEMMRCVMFPMLFWPGRDMRVRISKGGT